MRKLIYGLLIGLNALLFSSCGESDPGNAISLFKTVNVSASVAPNPYRVPLASGNTCTNGVISGATVTLDQDATVTVNSQVYSGVTVGQRVSLGGYTVTFQRANTASPVINDVISGFVGQQVSPGGTITFDVPLTSSAIKNALSTNAGINSCTPTSHSYYATIAITGTEEGGTEKTITTTVPVIYSNIAP